MFNLAKNQSMRNIFPFVLSLLMSIYSFGQDFNASDMIWKVAKQEVNATPNYPSNVDTLTNVYGLIGDTIIENQIWKKMYFSNNENLDLNPVLLGYTIQNEHIVTFKDTNNNNHQLYNFDLNIGDSVQYFEDEGVDYDYIFVENIDSILINGNFKKQFHFSTSLFPPFFLNEIWIEDIGSIHGPLFPINPQHFSNELPNHKKLTCCYFESDIIWDNPNYDYCYYHIVLPSPNFIQDGKQWNVRLSNFSNYGTEILFFEGDSIIDNITYKKLYASYDSLTTRNYKALIREENNKVYLRHYNEPEALIYDFNLSIGESTTIYSPEGYGFIEITINDISWLEYEGFFRKKYTLNGIYPEFWIEGIGSSFGPIYSKIYDFIICPDWTLTCAYADEQQIYQLEGAPCYSTSVGVNSLKNSPTLVYPNPVHLGNSILISNDIGIKKIQLFDYSGNQLKSIKLDHQDKYYIETKSLKKGVYLLKIVDIKGASSSNKLLIV